MDAPASTDTGRPNGSPRARLRRGGRGPWRALGPGTPREALARQSHLAANGDHETFGGQGIHQSVRPLVADGAPQRRDRHASIARTQHRDNAPANAPVARGVTALLPPRGLRYGPRAVTAEATQRARSATWPARDAERRADVHEGVMPACRRAARQEVRVERASFALRRDAAHRHAAEHATDVRVREGDRVAVREARDGGGRVGSDARERVEIRCAPGRSDRPGASDALQVAGAPVVAEAGPEAEDVG